MKRTITVIPADSHIRVNGVSYTLPFSPVHEDLHALQWQAGEGSAEFTGDPPVFKRLKGQEDYDAFIKPYVLLWEREHEQATAENAAKPPSLEEARAHKIEAINEETSQAILGGFLFTVDGQELRFSYRADDQRNFADAANAAALAKLGVPDVPQQITWNGWKEERTLVRLTLTPETFLALYVQGALAHKAKQMEIGSQRKVAAEAATTLEELEAV